MGYQILYDSDQKYTPQKRTYGRLAVLTGMALILFVLLVNSLWPKGSEKIRSFLLTDRGFVTAAALEAFADELENGTSMDIAFEAFCSDILTGAQRDLD